MRSSRPARSARLREQLDMRTRHVEVVRLDWKERQHAVDECPSVEPVRIVCQLHAHQELSAVTAAIAMSSSSAISVSGHLELAPNASESERLRAYARRGYEAALEDELERQRLETYRRWADEPELSETPRAAARRAAERGVYRDT